MTIHVTPQARRASEAALASADKELTALRARELGAEPVVFPGGHNGFLGGEYGQTGKPDEFAARLREVLAAR